MAWRVLGNQGLGRGRRRSRGHQGVKISGTLCRRGLADGRVGGQKGRFGFSIPDRPTNPEEGVKQRQSLHRQVGADTFVVIIVVNCCYYLCWNYLFWYCYYCRKLLFVVGSRIHAKSPGPPSKHNPLL